MTPHRDPALRALSSGLILASALVVLAGLASCGPLNDSGDGNGNGGDGGRGSSDAPGYYDGDGGPGNEPDYSPDAGPCAAEVTKAQQLPLDMFIMLDQSSSMSDTVSGGQTKWQSTTSALASFLSQSGLDGISVGIQFFGLPPTGGTTCTVVDCYQDSDCGPAACGPCDPDYLMCMGAYSEDSCSSADYAKAAVDIAPLPGVASAIATAISQHSPSTLTPTSAALEGALKYAKSWATAHQDHATIVVLATDGEPTECDTTLSNIDAIAAVGVNGTPRILTFVIGVGSSLSNLNGIAAAGGTTSAFIVDTNQNVNQQFLAALNAIRGTALGCQYKIPSPDGGTPDYHKVNVQFTPGGGQPQMIPQVADKAHCPSTGDAWYYDNPSAPTQILLCDSTCTRIRGSSTGEVDVLLGCTTVID